MKTNTATVKVNPETPVAPELIAESIIKVAEAFKKIEASGLKKRAIILLLVDMTGVSMGAIDKILTHAPRLADQYVDVKTAKNKR